MRQPENEQSNRRPLFYTAIAAGSIGVAAWIGGNLPGQGQANKPASKEVGCTPSGTQTYTFADSDGKRSVLAAALAIDGSGEGAGDPCFDEAQAAVESQLSSHNHPFPQPGEQIVIPQRLSPNPITRK